MREPGPEFLLHRQRERTLGGNRTAGRGYGYGIGPHRSAEVLRVLAAATAAAARGKE